MALSKIYLFDDASNGVKTDDYIKQLQILQKEHFWDKFIIKDGQYRFEAYVGNFCFQNGNWEQNSNEESIGNNQYTANFLIKKFNEALSKDNTIMLIDYYLIDNPTDETDVNALNFLRDELIANKDNMAKQRTRVLFYSSWPSEKMTREIGKLENPNVYYDGVDFQYDIDDIRYDIEEYFRSVNNIERSLNGDGT